MQANSITTPVVPLLGLNGIDLFQDPLFIELGDDRFSFEAIFEVDRFARAAALANPRIKMPELKAVLQGAGFNFVDAPGQRRVYWHSRFIDEHLLSARYSSFFVHFSDDCSFELLDGCFLATNRPALFNLISPTYQTDGQQTLLVSENHDIIYPDDQVWADPEMTRLIPIGPVCVIEEQFPNRASYEMAKTQLVESGYECVE